jgi:hypothetical protein
MTHIPKLSSLVLAAMFALGVVAAPGASAETARFTTQVGTPETANVHGAQINVDVLSLGGSNKMTCSTATLSGKALTAGSESMEVTLEPTYETCHTIVSILGAFVTRTMTITMNGCAYKFKATKKTEEVPYSADLTIECPAEKQIELHVYDTTAHNDVGTATLCTYDVSSQTIGNAIQLTNTEAEDIRAHSEAEVAVTNTIRNSICGEAASLTATYLGEDTLTATNEAGQSVGLTVS